jgi:WhiB family transcriptional regulator, redox-sensing transcriptional regulator
MTASHRVAHDQQLPCRGRDFDFWFADAPAELELAKRRCGRCPVRRACLLGALERREPWGVWGGEIFDRGAVIAHKRPRAPPHKDRRSTSYAGVSR